MLRSALSSILMKKKNRGSLVIDFATRATLILLEATIFVKSAQAVRVTVGANLKVNGGKSNLK